MPHGLPISAIRVVHVNRRIGLKVCTQDAESGIPVASCAFYVKSGLLNAMYQAFPVHRSVLFLD